MSHDSHEHAVRVFAAPQLLGGVWNWCLYGALVVQFYLYYWFASDFGNIERLTAPYISFFDTPILGSVVSLSVQFFFVYRIWVLSEKRWWRLCIFICLFSTVDAAAAFTNGIYVHVHGKFEQGEVWGFSHCWQAQGFGRYLQQSRLPTVGVASFLMVALYPDKNWFMCPTYVLGKLYSNNLFVSLNNLPAVASNSGRDPAAVAAQTPQRTPLLFRSERKQKRWIVLID
ncbi:hypothetical protein BGY98DRAFT_937704 [Russula aff. rugulosa BPL654]|nr:hypothetical protein BGY98DRAFT_937704 [Russula aff. rugulosa BPL654]